MNVFLAAIAALCWGSADFIGGYATKDGDTRQGETVLWFSQAIAATLVATLLLVPSFRQASSSDLLLGALSGLGLALGVKLLYSALATGRMAVVAPVSAGTCFVVSALGGLLNDGEVSTTQWFGIAAVLGSIIAVSVTRDEGGSMVRPLLLATLAGCGFGSQLFTLSFTSSDVIPVQLAGELVAFAVFSIGALRVRAALPATNRALTALCGVLRACGTFAFIAAVAVASNAATGVAANLFPVFTALAAFVVLRERLSLRQLVAALVALAGLVLLAL
jgi:drug/metabolite transporter (DMT)-like permease